MYSTINMEQSFLHAHCSTVSLTSFRCSTGPAIPRVVSHESGDYRTTTLPPGRPLRAHRALPECRYRPNWLPPSPPGSPNYFRHPADGYSRTALSAHSLTITCLQICPGFHHTAVLLLTEVYTNRYPHGLP